MKKILILANNHIGLYKFRKELIEALIERGNKVYIALPYGELVEPLISIGCEFIDTPMDRRGINPLTDLELMMKYKKCIKKVSPDLVITYTIKPNIYGGIVSRILKVPYITNITGLGTAFQQEGILKKVIVKLYQVALGKVKYILFENKENQKVFIENKITSLEKTVVMNGAGVNLEEYAFTDMPEGDLIRFLFIGRVMKEKGIDELFSVAKAIKKHYAHVEFDIVGPFEDDYEDLVKQYEKDKIINYYGYQEDVRPFIKNCHCFILPSYHEGMANTLLEAAAMGRPLITSNIHGCKEAVEDNGILITVKNQASLDEAVKKFLKLSPQIRTNMAKKSREIVELRFNKKNIIEQTLKYIEERK